jgi:hypothetical protein
MSTEGRFAMRVKIIALALIGAVSLAVFGGIAVAQQDRYALKLGLLSFDDFKGYENWRVVAVSQTKTQLKVIVANDVMRQAFSRRLQGGEDRVEHEKEHQGALLRGGAGHTASGCDDRKRQQEISGHAWMGVWQFQL